MAGIFYVYEHWRPDRDECFYVGKGHGKRANDMKKARNRFHKFIQAKLSKMGLMVEVRIVRGELDEAEALALEVERIAFWRANGTDIANLTDGGEGTSGFVPSLELRQLWSEQRKGKKLNLTPEQRQRMSEHARRITRPAGWKKSPESVEKTRQANLGKVRSEETRARIKAAKSATPSFLGKHHTAETIEKIRAPQVGRPKSEETKARMRKPKSEAHKEKLRQANLGKKLSEEAKEKLRQMYTGVPRSLEVREKMKASWAARRAKLAIEKQTVDLFSSKDRV